MSVKISDLPAAGSISDSAVYPLVEAGATQKATSTQLAQYMSNKIKSSVALAPGAPGNFQVIHGLSSEPSAALIQMTSGGQIWFQTPAYDNAYLYLVASGGTVTGNAIIFI